MEWFVSRIPVIHPSPLPPIYAIFTLDNPHDYSSRLEPTSQNYAWVSLCGILFDDWAEDFLPRPILLKEQEFSTELNMTLLWATTGLSSTKIIR